LKLSKFLNEALVPAGGLPFKGSVGHFPRVRSGRHGDSDRDANGSNLFHRFLLE
jgi:hypothetical protein